MGVVNPPLLNFEMDDIVIDELHLMLRVTDILIRNLISAMSHYDERRFHVSSGNDENHLQLIQTVIKSCGISFRVMSITTEHINV